MNAQALSDIKDAHGRPNAKLFEYPLLSVLLAQTSRLPG
jgi:hypothetical protein